MARSNLPFPAPTSTSSTQAASSSDQTRRSTSRGSFHASTADYLKMSDGAKFQATNPDGSTFSAAPPAAFGFLTANPAQISVNGSSLGVPQGQTLGLVG